MTDWNRELHLAEIEQSGELPTTPLMDEIVAICRAGHERALRKIAEPHEAIECLFCGDAHSGDCIYEPSGESYTAWRARHEERWWAERSNQGRE